MTPDKVMKLIALAGSPNENEARTAAWMACQAIREGGLQVVASTAWRAPPPPPPPRPEPPPPPPRPSYADAKKQAVERKRITLRYDGWCKVCRTDIPAGAEAWWAAGEGCVCKRCYR